MGILKVQNLTKMFGGLAALYNVSFNVEPEEIKAVIGPNGAGKTTLFNIIAGYYKASKGDIHFEGKSIKNNKSHQIALMGVSRTFQNLQTFANMTVIENVMVGCHKWSSSGFLSSIFRTQGFLYEEKKIYEKSLEKLHFVGLEHKKEQIAGSLPFGEQKILEVARAFASEPRLLLLDEPAAGLNETETKTIARLIEKVRQFGTTIILVEHDMSMVMGISDEIVVLNYGEVIAEGTPTDIKSNQNVIDAYLGGDGEDA